MMFQPRNDGLARGGGRGGALGNSGRCSCADAGLVIRVPSPGPGPGRRRRDPALPAAGGAQSRARSPPRHRVRAPLGGRGGSCPGTASKPRSTQRPGQPPAGWRHRGHSPSAPGDSRGRPAGAHRGWDGPPAEPKGCMGSSKETLPALPLPTPPPSPPPEKKGEKRESRAAVAGKSLLSHLPAPLSLPSPLQVRTRRRRRRPGPAARPLGACSGRGRQGLDRSGGFLSPRPARAPEGEASPLQDKFQKEIKPRDFGEVRALNPLKMVVSEEGRLGYNHRETGFYYMKIFVFEKGGQRSGPAQFQLRETRFHNLSGTSSCVTNGVPCDCYCFAALPDLQ